MEAALTQQQVGGLYRAGQLETFCPQAGGAATGDNPARNMFSQEVRECSLNKVQERQVFNHGSLLIKVSS